MDHVRQYFIFYAIQVAIWTSWLRTLGWGGLGVGFGAGGGISITSGHSFMDGGFGDI